MSTCTLSQVDEQSSQSSARGEARVFSPDVICVGFGLSSIAIAVALAECNPEGDVYFLERRAKFTWNSGNLLPGNKIRSSFLRDLATTRNPRSKFTFMNFLHSTNQLVAFTNASSLQPSKLIMGQYLAWVEEQIRSLGWVYYGREVVQIEPIKDSCTRQVLGFNVHYNDLATGVHSRLTAKRVVVATGSTPHIPQTLSNSEIAPYVIHSSDSGDILSREKPTIPDVAVVGGGQEGAEIYEQLQKHDGLHRASFFIEDSALRPVDDTAFARNLVDAPESKMAILPPEIRQSIARDPRSLKEATVTVDLLERLYDMDYAQKVRGTQPSEWRFSVEPLAEVVGAEIVAASSSQPRIRLHLKDPSTGALKKSERSFHVIIAATGYRTCTDPLLSSLSSNLDGVSVSVDRDYRVNFKNGCIRKGCGVWSLVALKDRTPRDEVFLHLAEQGKTVLESIISVIQEDNDREEQPERLSML